ncbi:hypothetical protein LMG33818_002644 [Halomonadaceae bacterium LMG 33818]|uniref:TraR/DksA C4-type zinc finger protein n=1 Tax=Cernens ardua TaxID=3402176 RepID=UPI003EDBA66F
MADFADRAQASSEETLRRVLSVRRRYERKEHTGDCIDCGEDIPEARRKALPFARRCVDCQSMREHKKRVHH